MNTYCKAMYHLFWAGLLRVSLVVVFSAMLVFSVVGSVPVHAKPLYALGAYPNSSVVLGSSTTITPDAAPTGTSSINVSTDANFKGAFVADPSTGVVRITNAHPAGTYTVTVTAFGSSPDSATFTLTVTDGVACATTPGFTGMPSLAVGTGPAVLTVGDFNNDGNQDLAVPNLGSNPGTVSIRLGDGDGTFSSAADVATGYLGVRSAAVGDFNGDGKQDLAVVNRSSDRITIHLGNGDGTFAAPTNFAAGDYSTHVRVGDFDNDAWQDLAVLDAENDSVSIYLGNGDGTFGSPTSVSVVAIPYGLVVGDLNGDGDQDLVIGSNVAGGGVSIRLGHGDGTFTAMPDLSWSGVAQGVALGDFNNDGDQDVFIGGETDSVSVRLGDGDGTFDGSSPIVVSVTGQGWSPVVVDFNNDGNQDFAVTNASLNSVSIRLGDGAGGFSAIADVSSGGTAAYAIVEGDFNNDSKLDLAVTNSVSNTVGILLGNLPLCYDGNGNDGGSAPAAATYVPGATVTVSDNTGSLVKTGHTFAGWNTATDGSGTSYVPVVTFTITSPTILYAQWTVAVTPGATGGDGPGGVSVADGSSSLALWLRPDRGVYMDTGCSTAAANGQDVACWQDQSGSGQDVMQNTAARRPTYNTSVLNGMPALNYVGQLGGNPSGDVLTGTLSAYSGDQPYTIFAAFNPSNNNQENLFAVGNPTLNNNIAYHPNLTNERRLYHYGDDLTVSPIVAGWQMGTFRYTAVGGTINQFMYTNSTQVGSRTTTAALALPTDPILSIGGYDNRTGGAAEELTGDLGEIIFFSASLTDTERILVENYLSAKYNIAMSANDVYDGDDAGSGDFDLDMAGIGRYGGSSHTQAHSVGLIVANRTFLQDNGDWLTFAHLTPVNSNTNADLPTTGDWASAPDPMRWARHWYFDLTDANANGGAVDIIFDFSEGGMNGGALPSGPAGNYRLLGRANSTGQFSDIATAAAIVGDQVQFLGVDVTLLSSNFTVGTLDATTSPTTVNLSALRAEPVARALVFSVGLGAILVILAGAMLAIRSKQRRSQP